MKRLLILLCVLAMLLSLPGVASASKPVQGTFTITGYTSTIYDYDILKSGRIKFHLEAIGWVSPGPNSEYFNGTFTYEEWGNFYVDFVTGKGSGTNHGVMTITTSGDSVEIAFRGKSTITDLVPLPPPYPPAPVGFVEGTFTVLSGTGAYANLHGQGTYTGNIPPPGELFSVDFTGKFHTDP